MRNNWTREETIVAFNVYCKIPFKNSSKNHPEVIKYANLLGRTPSALNMKIGNLGRLDPELKKRGITGLVNGSKLEEDIWDEFNGNWDELAFESERIIANLQGQELDEFYIKEYPKGKEIERSIRVRVNQSFFRNSVLSAYNNECCITGINIPQLLVASHIIPWKNNIERTNPKNGLCLNPFHDKAFDRGFFTINEDYRITVSNKILHSKNFGISDYLIKTHNRHILLPDKFFPSQEFLEFHRTNIFQK
ncbi:HNH endonuclease [bacterium]|nr:HNH endonuclease [bacterium]